MASGYVRRVVVLFVEDCADMRALYADALERTGMTVHCARTIEDAEALLADGLQPDLVVMDRELPDGDGFELATRLKAVFEFPIVGFTATAPHEAMRAAHEAGMDGFVAKPCPADKLVSLALILLGSAARASAC